MMMAAVTLRAKNISIIIVAVKKHMIQNAAGRNGVSCLVYNFKQMQEFVNEC